MVDPVMHDLNRHLAELDQAEARQAAEEAKVEEMMAEPKTVKEILEEMVFNGQIDLPGDIAAIVTSHADDKAVHLIRQFDRWMDMVREEAKTLAPDLVKADLDRAIFEEGEDRAMDQEDRANGY